jgi:hypothetical protein
MEGHLAVHKTLHVVRRRDTAKGNSVFFKNLFLNAPKVCNFQSAMGHCSTYEYYWCSGSAVAANLWIVTSCFIKTGKNPKYTEE